jgi:putative ABC transport system ATP-binding protein
MTSPILEALQLGRQHPTGQRWLLKNISFEVPAGTTLAVTGASGAGKTLLLRALAMLDPLEFGEVRFRGRTPLRSAVPNFRRQVIYLHQRPVLPGETIADAVQQPFALAVHRHRQFDRDRIIALLKHWGRNAAFLDKRTADLSGGESQLAALARALQLDPVVLLLDEPTSALDAPTAAAVEDYLHRWLADSPSDRAMVWVGHDTVQIRRIADRVLHMEAGRVQLA